MVKLEDAHCTSYSPFATSPFQPWRPILWPSLPSNLQSALTGLCCPMILSFVSAFRRHQPKISWEKWNIRSPHTLLALPWLWQCSMFYAPLSWFYAFSLRCGLKICLSLSLQTKGNGFPLLSINGCFSSLYLLLPLILCTAPLIVPSLNSLRLINKQNVVYAYNRIY